MNNKMIQNPEVQLSSLQKGDCFIFHELPYIISKTYWDEECIPKRKIWVSTMKFDNKEWHSVGDVIVYQISKGLYDIFPKYKNTPSTMKEKVDELRDLLSHLDTLVYKLSGGWDKTELIGNGTVKENVNNYRNLGTNIQYTITEILNEHGNEITPCHKSNKRYSVFDLGNDE